MPTPKVKRSEQLSFRAEPALVERIDSLRADMKERLRGVDLSRSDLLKTLVEQSLPLMEIEYGSDRYAGAIGEDEGRGELARTIAGLFDLAERLNLDLSKTPWGDRLKPDE